VFHVIARLGIAVEDDRCDHQSETANLDQARNLAEQHEAHNRSGSRQRDEQTPTPAPAARSNGSPNVGAANSSPTGVTTMAATNKVRVGPKEFREHFLHCPPVRPIGNGVRITASGWTNSSIAFEMRSASPVFRPSQKLG
jgi:hypothetical protein